ncbi:hypothetical protein JHK87_055359 [Glycine soja]|nr:hypothetical protein JHK87_055359 [Glycine soja]
MYDAAPHSSPPNPPHHALSRVRLPHHNNNSAILDSRMSHSFIPRDDPRRFHSFFGSGVVFSPLYLFIHSRSLVLREKELINLRGDGKGVRTLSDIIYDFDTYNDLGNPDEGVELTRPTLDMHAESRVEMPLPMYVPRDEQFDESKLNTFVIKRLKAVVHNLIPGLKASLSANNHDFNRFSDIDDLYSEGLPLQDEILKKIPFLQVLTKIQECGQGLLKYDTPKIISKDKFAWLRDDEFARQAIAGVNLVNIEGLKVFPPSTNFIPLNLSGNKLSLRPSSKWKHVVTPPMDATTNWKWQLAKAHVCANDAGVHQLVNHW